MMRRGIIAAALALSLLLATATVAQADRSFAVRYATSTNGDIAFAGNAITTCVDSTACTAARSGTGNNNDFVERYIDVDTTDGRPSSSRASLGLPAGTTVLFAGLYWGGSVTTSSLPTDANVVHLDTPGTSTYQRIVASQVDRAGDAYQGFADVTSLVQAGGTGAYTLADVKVSLSQSGNNRYGGWSLVVVYRDGAEPPRSMKVFDGLVAVNSGASSVSIPLSGFLTPPSGAVNTRLGVVAYDGDRGPGSAFTGDSLRLNGQAISDALNPATNFFNSSITRLGTAVTSRDPAYANTLGYDADIVDASGRLANGATSATIGLTTSGETYTPGVVAFATELAAPRISPGKTVADVNGGDVEQGDILEYRITGTNTGQDTATQLRLADGIPAGTTYMPGSLQQATTSGATPTARTDVAGDDTAEYVGGARSVTARLGTGATATAGGRLVPNASFELRFRVRVDADLLPGAAVSNQAQLNFVGDQTGLVFSNIPTPLATSVVRSPDLALTKTHTGSAVRGTRVEYSITAANVGDGAARGIRTVTDTLPAGLVADGVPSGTGWSCALVDRAVTCTRSDVLAAGAAHPPITVPARVAQAAPDQLINGASIDAPGDGNPSNDAATDPLGATSNADLGVSKTASAPNATVGQSVAFTLGLGNAGPTDATGVTLDDTLPEGLVPTAAPGCTIDGQAVTCTVGALAAGAQASRIITATVTAAAAGRTLENEVTAIGDQPDLDASDNRATAAMAVGPETDLNLTKEIAPSPLTAGGPVRFTLRVRNDGPSPATSVTVQDPLPVTMRSATITSDPAGAACGITQDVARCTFDRIAAGATVRVEIEGTLDPAGGPDRTLANTASVDGAERDPDPAGNSATATAPVTESADVYVAKTATPAAVRAGERISYTLVAGNRGPSVARATVLSDRLPDALAPAATPAGCTLADRLLTCALGDLQPGAERELTIAADVAPGFTGDLENTVRAESASPDPDGEPATATATTPVSALADLGVTKRAAPATVAGGEEVTFTVDVRNDGPSSAPSAQLVDTLPEGLEPLSAAGCTVGGQAVNCALGDLVPGATATVTIVARAAAGQAAGTLENRAAASSGAEDPVPGNDVGVAAVTIAPRAGLEVAKRAAPATAVAGERVTFTVDLVNRGPSVARGVTLDDPLPPVLTAIEVEGPECAAAGGRVTCAYGDLAPGASRSVQISGLVPPSYDGALSNTATAASPTPDADPDDNRATVDVPVARIADVRVEKHLDPPIVTAGGPVTYTLRVENAGPGVADAVTLSDSVPAAVTITGVTPAGACTRTLQDVSCGFGALAPGETREVTITGTVAPGFAGRLENRATVDSPTPDPAPANNTDVAVSDADARADLSITKSAPAQVRAGEPLTYALRVTNAGPSDAVDVDVRDALPPGVALVFVEPAAACSTGGGTVQCTLGTVPAGASRDITITTLVDPAADAGPLVNTATASSDTLDPDAGDRSATATTDVASEADVSVDKQASPDPVTAGEAIAYTIRVANAGPGVARAVVVRDAVPGAIAVTSVTPGADCARSGQDVTCDLGDLPPRAEREIVIAGTVADGATGTLDNTASATAATTDPVAENDADAVATPVLASAALELTKSAAPDPAVAGRPLTYTLRLTNGGPSAATDVRLHDPVPAALAVESVSAPCEVVARDVDCAFGTLHAGASRTVTVTGTLDPAATGTLRNEATATTATPGPNPAVATALTDVVTEVGLTLTKTAGATEVTAGEEVAFTLAAANSGPSRAVDAQVTDTLPEGLSLVSPPAGCTADGPVVTCSLGDLDPGAERILTLRAAAAPGAAAGPRVNRATLASPSAPAPVTAQAGVELVRSADVRLRKDAAPEPATAGEPITYTLTATNDGPSTADGVVVSDTLPDGIALTAGAPQGCDVAAGVVTCALGTLAPGEARSVRIDARVATGLQDALENVATATADTPDPNAADNTARITTPVRRRADLRVAKLAEPATARAGEPLIYRIAVGNDGPSDARDVVLDDPLPEGFVATDVTPTPACAVAGGRLHCALETLAPGAQREIVLTGAVEPSRIAALENTATVGSSTPDEEPDNNSASIGTPVAVVADLELAKVAEEPTVAAGTDAVWVLTLTNRGPATATGVTLHDGLPAGTGARAVTPDGTCVALDRDVDCAFGDVAPGGSRTVRVTARVAPEAQGELRNAAIADSASPDPDRDDNAASAPVSAVGLADLHVTKRGLSDDAIAGADLTYRLRVVNNGPSVARTVVVTDRLPDTLIAPVTATGPCTVTGRDISCEPGTLAPGEELVVDVTARVGPGVHAGTEIVNTAQVSTSTADPRAIDNSDTETTNAATRADLQVAKTGPAAAGAGDAISYTVSVTNDGPSDAAGVALTDTLPPELLDAAFAPEAPECQVLGSRAVCAVGDLPLGQSRSYTITGRLDPDAPAGTVVNRAEAHADTDDPVAANDAAEAATEVTSTADVAVAKTGDATATAGGPLGYRLTATNAGPATAHDVVLEDALPAGVTLLSTDPSTCTGTTTVSCALGDLRPGESQVVTLATRVAPGTRGTLANVASVRAANDPGPDANDRAQFETAVAASADLRIVKSVAPRPLVPGAPAAYVLRVENDGPSSATGVVVRDELPAALRDVAVEDSGGATCTLPPGALDCRVAALAPGATLEIRLGARVAPDATGEVSNAATVGSDTPDPDPGDNGTSVTAPLAPLADVSLTKTASPTTVRAGEQVTYTFTARNAGPSTAAAVQLGDTLPEGLAPLALPPGCTITGRALACALGDIGPDAEATVAITAEVAPSARGTLRNEASVHTPTADPDPADDVAEASVDVTGAADLGVEMTVDRTQASAGETLVYTLAVTNYGPSTALAATLSDDAPPGLALVSVSPATGCDTTERSLSCTLGDVAPGETRSFTLEARIDPGFTGPLANAAGVGSDTADPNAANDADAVTVTADALARVRLGKTADPEPAVAGMPFAYTLTARNAGPSLARAVQVVDDVPAGLAIERVTPADECSRTGQLVECTFDALAPGAEREIVIAGTLAPAATGPLENTAIATSPTPDPEQDDNTARRVTDVAASADLSLEKTVSPAAVLAGANATFRLRVHNDGPSTARAVAVDDLLDPVLTLVSATPSQGSCDERVRCALGALAPGAEATVDIVVQTGAVAATTTLGNSARVSAESSDPSGGNDVGIATLTVQRAADLALEKTISPDAPVAGAPLTYTLTARNKGPGVATSVVLTDPLPTELSVTAVRVLQGGGDCVVEPPSLLRCTFDALGPGDAASVAVDGELPRSAGGERLVNTASVGSDEGDPAPGDNEATVERQVAPAPALPADLSVVKTGPATAAAGGEVSWAIDVANAGPGPATGVVVTDELPAGTTLVRATPSQGTCSAENGVVRCALGTVASGATAVVTLAASLSGVAPGATLVNRARVAGAEPDPEGADDQSQASTRVVEAAAVPVDLRLAKRQLGAAQVGQPLSYEIEVRNAGASDAADVVVTDRLPDVVRYEAVRSTQGTCTGGTTVVCRLGALPAGATALVTVTVTPLAAGEIRNQASVTAGQPLGTAGDQSSALGTARRSSGLTIRKIASRRRARTGDAVRYTIRLRNTGTVVARQVRVCDRLPVRMTYVHARGARFRDGRACWTRGRLARGASWTVTLGARIDPHARRGVVRNLGRARAQNLRTVSDGARTRVVGRPAQQGGGVTG